MPLTFGAWLRRVRNAKRLSLRELGERVKISHSKIDLLEKDARKPKQDDVVALACSLGEDPNEALMLAGYLPNARINEYDPLLARVERALSAIPPERRRRAVEAFEALTAT